MNTETAETQTRRRLIPVTKWNEYYEFPTVPGLRWLIFNEKENGFSRCVRRIGRRVAIDEAEYFRWVDEQNGVGSG